MMCRTPFTLKHSSTHFASANQPLTGVRDFKWKYWHATDAKSDEDDKRIVDTKHDIDATRAPPEMKGKIDKAKEEKSVSKKTKDTKGV